MYEEKYGVNLIKRKEDYNNLYISVKETLTEISYFIFVPKLSKTNWKFYQNTVKIRKQIVFIYTAPKQISYVKYIYYITKDLSIVILNLRKYKPLFFFRI